MKFSINVSARAMGFSKTIKQDDLFLNKTANLSISHEWTNRCLVKDASSGLTVNDSSRDVQIDEYKMPLFILDGSKPSFLFKFFG